MASSSSHTASKAHIFAKKERCRVVRMIIGCPDLFSTRDQKFIKQAWAHLDNEPDPIPFRFLTKTAMARTRERSQSPESGIDEAVVKRLKTSHIHADSLILSQKPAQQFHADLFDHNNIARLNVDYQANRPFKYSVVDKLFQDELLQKVKDECLGELSFTEKETDIYKVRFPRTTRIYSHPIASRSTKLATLLPSIILTSPKYPAYPHSSLSAMPSIRPSSASSSAQ